MSGYFDLLPKALLQVRGSGGDDTDWFDAMQVSNWGFGWAKLEEFGLVKRYRDKSIKPGDGLDMVYKLTEEGVARALQSLQSDKALEHVAQETRKEAASLYISNPSYGTI